MVFLLQGFACRGGGQWQYQKKVSKKKKKKVFLGKQMTAIIISMRLFLKFDLETIEKLNLFAIFFFTIYITGG